MNEQPRRFEKKLVTEDGQEFIIAATNERILDAMMLRYFEGCKDSRVTTAVLVKIIANTKDWMPHAQEITRRALKQDRDFFEKLGRALAEFRGDIFTRDELFVLYNWDGQEFAPAQVPPLKYFTDQAAYDYMLARGGSEMTFDAYRKMRQRLGLTPEKPVQIRGCVVRDGTAVLSP